MTADDAPRCRICAGAVRECLDLGRQPVSNAFPRPDEVGRESYFRLAIGFCTECTMVQQLHEVSRERMFRADYPYRSSTSAGLRQHFERMAQVLAETELRRPEDLVVEIGSNDGIMLEWMHAAGVRHLGVDPSAEAAAVAAAKGVRTRVEFFEESSAARIRAAEGPAKLIFSANTVSHVADLGSVFRGVDRLLAPDGVFVFEDRYLGDIIEQTYFDQIYDEHFHLFAVRSVQAAVTRFGFELIDAERFGVHGGSIRYTVARPGARRRAPAVAGLLAAERGLGLGEEQTFARFGQRVDRIRHDLVTLLRELRAAGRRVVGYGATSKSATVTNYCRIGPDLVPFICDTTPEKQGRLSPGAHIPIRPASLFADPYPDYALLFAWNHAAEIMAKEQEFRDRGGQWILYVPRVHVI